ncbi:hypothetical protein [Legionella moravica]|uniref:hypothetical protein n=1 Tax=Legionella moravica TaxID=39962 RepID=UPI000404AC8D|nr:hypothetical protein [Legionella moravica]
MVINRFSILFIACFFMIFQQSTHSQVLVEKPSTQESSSRTVTESKPIKPGNVIHGENLVVN